IVSLAGRPRYQIERATEATLADAKDVEIVRIVKQGVRPAGRNFGKLVHALLQEAELPARKENLQAIAGVEARILGSEAGDVEPAIQTALTALTHPLLAAISGAARVHREFPVMLRQSGSLIEGVIDLAFLDGE